MSGAAPTLRPLHPDDAEACDAIVASLPYHFGDPGGRAACARAVRESEGLVAVMGGEVAGFLTLNRFEAAVEITWMAVHSDRRGRGIGRALLDRLAAELAGTARYLVVTTLSDSVPEPGVEDGYARTRRFYRRNGFEPVFEPSGWWRPDSQAVLMVRAVT
jgi:GNAT superfamily N-acetyltransferase